MRREELPFTGRFWNILCGFRFLLVFIFSLSITFLVLIGMTYFFLGTDEAGAAVLQLSAIVLLFMIPTLAFCIVTCNKMERR